MAQLPIAFYAVFTVAWPALEMVMTPPHMQFRVQTLVRAGILPILTVAEPGDQGATVLGMQGWGVKTPDAAAVADATWGLANEVHMTNGITLAIGLLSIILAAGTLFAFTLLAGVMTSELGPVPKLHVAIAPMTTCWGINPPNYELRFANSDSPSRP
jgi:hypothetical protein